MSGTLASWLEKALDQSAGNDANVAEAPVAIFWPDKAREWESVIDHLRSSRRILVLGPYDPARRVGPALWIRCAVAGTLPVDGPEGPTFIYLPGVGRDDLRVAAANDRVLAPLASLQHRSQWFVQPKNGRDWTIRTLLTNKDRGLGLAVDGDEGTAKALMSGVNELMHQPLSRLAGRYLDESFLNSLLNPDPVRLMLRWIDDPAAVRSELSGASWDAFAAQSKKEFGVEPGAAGVIEAARRLAESCGVWEQVWQRFRESPTDYPNIPTRLRDAKPLELFTPSSLAWPQDNEAAEDQLRSQLLDLQALTASGASAEIERMENAHRARRGSVWSQLGQAPLALALEHLAELARSCSQASTSGGIAGLRQSYEANGWKCDLAALRALGEVRDHGDVKAIASALDAIYRPWLELGAKSLQDAIGPEANSGNYQADRAPEPDRGEVVMFVDGLRLDVAHLLAERLEGAGARVETDVRFAALPTVTQTAKPVLVPIDQALLGPGKALEACRASSGAAAGVQTLRSLLNDAGIQVLASQDLGDPSRIGWTEVGEIDHIGHDAGYRLAQQIDVEVAKIALRTRDLLDAGWSVVRIVTDHGWLLLPSGLPKNDSLPVAATIAKKGRCARIKDGALVEVPTVPWHWDKDVMIAVAPGISCFEVNQQYEHGGVSPQECFVPQLRVTASAQTPSCRAELMSIKWRGLTLVVEFADLPAGAKVDLRLHAGDPSSSIAALARLTSGTGKVILLVEDEDLEGASAQLVVVDQSGTLLLQRETVVGANR